MQGSCRRSGHAVMERPRITATSPAAAEGIALRRGACSRPSAAGAEGADVCVRQKARAGSGALIAACAR